MDILLELRSLGYIVRYEYNPVEQLIYYTVTCGDELVDMGTADEIHWEGRLKDICVECIRCKDEN